MRKPVNPYESGSVITSAMALYEFAMASNAVLYIGEMQERVRDTQHDIYLIDGQMVMMLLPAECPIDIEIELRPEGV